MMNSKLTLSAALAISLLGIAAASAADLPARPVYTKAPAYVVPSISWTGCYVGGNAGGGWTKVNVGGVAFAGVPNPFIDYGGQNGSAVMGGGQVGCDYQFASNWVVGIQGQGELERSIPRTPSSVFRALPPNSESRTSKL